MELPSGLDSLLIIMLVAACAPFIVAMLPGPRIPEVALLLVLGILIGPHALGVAHVGTEIRLLSDLGLAMLFFAAGFELDIDALRGGASARHWPDRSRSRRDSRSWARWPPPGSCTPTPQSRSH